MRRLNCFHLPRWLPLPFGGRGSWSAACSGLTQCLIALIFFISSHARAGSPDLLHNVLNELSQHTAVRAAFTQQRQNPALAQPQTSNGQLLFVTGHGMLWQVEQPYQETLALTGSRTARIDASGHTQAVRNERGVSQISQMLQSMLAGQIDAVLRQFNVSADGTAAQWTLHFTPKQARVAQVLKDIQLDGGAFLQGIRITMRDGTQTDIHMTDTRDAGPLSALEKHALGLP
jgi:outer membrane lipoprotein-sorting protein